MILSLEQRNHEIIPTYIGMINIILIFEGIGNYH